MLLNICSSYCCQPKLLCMSYPVGDKVLKELSIRTEGKDLHDPDQSRLFTWPIYCRPSSCLHINTAITSYHGGLLNPWPEDTIPHCNYQHLIVFMDTTYYNVFIERHQQMVADWLIPELFQSRIDLMTWKIIRLLLGSGPLYIFICVVSVARVIVNLVGR